MSSPFDEQKYKSLLEGLRIAEISIAECFAHNDCRLEPDFWTQNNNSHIKTIKGGEIIDFVQYGTSKELNEEGNGFPILRLNEFNSHFIGIPSKYCSIITKNDFESLRLKKGDVLITRTNGNPNLVGKCALVMKDTNYAYASYLFKIRPKENIINSSTLVAFLLSKYGRKEIDKYSMTSNQTNFSPAKFREIDIPLFSQSFNGIINDLYSNSFEKLSHSQTLYHQAEELLLETIGLNPKGSHICSPNDNHLPHSTPTGSHVGNNATDSINMRPFGSGRNINIKSLKESFLSTGRLDAEYYQPKYEEIETLIKSQPYSTIDKEFEINKTVVDYSAKQYNYIEIGDINVGNGAYCYNLIETVELPANAKIASSNGDILISKVRPNRGAVSIIQENIPNLVVSGAFTVLQEKNNYKKEVLFMLLRTENYREWLLKYNVGTSYPVIKDEDVLSLPIPLIDKNIQQEISELIAQSFALRRESERLLAEAKEMVEKEIEIEKGGTL